MRLKKMMPEAHKLYRRVRIMAAGKGYTLETKAISLCVYYTK